MIILAKSVAKKWWSRKPSIYSKNWRSRDFVRYSSSLKTENITCSFIDQVDDGAWGSKIYLNPTVIQLNQKVDI